MLSERVRGALRRVTFETDLDQHQALARLSRPGTLAIMPSLEDNSPAVVYECLERGIPFIASDRGGASELVAAEDRPRVLFEPTTTGVASAIERALTDGEMLRPARAAFDDTSTVERWLEVVSHEPVPVVAAAGASDVESAWDLRAGDVRDAALRAQAASGADVVTCGVRVAGREHLFSGEPGGLGLLSNDYGKVVLIRRGLDDGTTPEWPLLARLSAEGAGIVSIPLPFLESSTPPATLETAPGEALLIVESLERSLPPALRSLARLAAGLAAETRTAAGAPTHGRLRRLARAVRRRVR